MKLVTKGERKDGHREPTPLWLSDPDYPAPCPCGDIWMEGDPLVMVTGETGLKCLMHLRCMPSAMMNLDDEL